MSELYTPNDWQNLEPFDTSSISETSIIHAGSGEVFDPATRERRSFEVFIAEEPDGFYGFATAEGDENKYLGYNPLTPGNAADIAFASSSGEGVEFTGLVAESDSTFSYRFEDMRNRTLNLLVRADGSVYCQKIGGSTGKLA